MTIALKDCEICKRTGEVVNQKTVPYREEGDYENYSDKNGWARRVSLPVSVTDPINCETCKGFGHMSHRQHSAWKSATMANRYAGTKAAMQCYICYGQKMTVQLDCFFECTNCGGFGQLPVWAGMEDAILPNGIDINDYMKKEFTRDYMKEIKIEVIRLNQAVTWNEYHLGVGTVYSSTDYGKLWKMSDEEIKEYIRADLSEKGSNQYSKFVGRESRQFCDTILVLVKPMGYTVNTSVTLSGNRRSGLPPTYTDALLDSPQF